MTNPRDFLPAKYKSSSPTTSPAGDANDSKIAEPPAAEEKVSRPADAGSESPSDFNLDNSPWADLAKEPTATATASPSFTQTPNEAAAMTVDEESSLSSADSLSNEEDALTPASAAPAATASTPSFTPTKPKAKNGAKLAGLLVLAFLVVGIISSFILLNQNQDNRQQASGTEAYPPNPDGTCDPEYVLVTSVANGSKWCIIPPARGGGGEEPTSCGAGEALVINSETGKKMCVPSYQTVSGNVSGNASCEGCYGTCYGNSASSTEGGSSSGVVGGAGTTTQCTAADWNNPNVLIAGTYWHCTPGTNICGRYTLNIPSTLEAAVLYFANNSDLAESLLNQSTPVVLQANNGNPMQLELAPFLTCGGTTDGYNSLSSSQCVAGNGICGWTTTVPVVVTYANGTTGTINQERCYLDGQYYLDNYVNNPNGNYTWSPYNTGCGDGVHDYPGSSPIPGSGNTDSAYLGDCNTWHFTQCLNAGTGVNGYGCDATTTPGGNDDPPNEPPATTTPPTTTTPPPSGTPTPTPTPPPSLLCTDIEMLDATGNLMTGSDDENLRDGDQVRFRSSYSGGDGSENVRFEFRILAPNILAWQDLTNTNPNVSAPDISAVYTIISSGHHIIQSRICVDDVCRAWEDTSDSNSTLNRSSGTCRPINGAGPTDRRLYFCEEDSDCPDDRYTCETT